MRDKANDKARLELMIEAIDTINEYLKTVTSFEEFQANKLLCHGVVYNLQCIGECAYKLSRPFIDTHKETDWQGMEGLRHVLVHDYYNINIATVWAIVTNDLQPLKLTIKTILASPSPDA